MYFVLKITLWPSFVPLHSFIDALWPSWSAEGNPSLFKERSLRLRGLSSLGSSPSTDRPPSSRHSVRSSAAGTMTATLWSSTTLHKSFSSFSSDRLWRLNQMFVFWIIVQNVNVSVHVLNECSEVQLKDTFLITLPNEDECWQLNVWWS